MKKTSDASVTKKALKALKEELGISGNRYGYFGIKASKDCGGFAISTLGGKLEGFHSASTSPECQAFCEKMSRVHGSICEKCFSRRSIIPEEGGYKAGLREVLAHNTDWMNQSHDIEEFPVLNDLYFRIESHGDVDNPIQAENFIKFCLRNPETHFTAWTKNPLAWNEAFKEGKPKNLIMIYSSPMINIEVKYENIVKVFPWVDKVFTVFSLEYIALHRDLIPTINCGSRQCLACMLCYRPNGTRQIREILK